MKLIIGGACQGKRSFARQTWNLQDHEIFSCQGENIDFSCKCIANIEEFTYACAQAHRDPVEIFRENRALWADSILICQDLFCGVVPLGAELRRWRQDTGLLCQYLAEQAESVHRIFCGLEQRLK